MTDTATAGLTLSPTSLTVAEGSTTHTYTVVLTTEPSDTVMVNINQDGEVTTMPAALTFTATEWNTAQTVTLTAAPDVDTTDDDTTLTHTASGGGYDSVAAVDLVVTVSDIITVNVPDVPDQNYIVNTTVNTLLPEATDAPGPLAYALEGDIPNGLIFDTTTRIISGTPTQETPGTTLTYQLTDSAGNQYRSIFIVTVSAINTTDIARLNDRIMARASQAINANTLEVVAARVKSAAGGGGGGAPAPAYQFGGQSSVSGLLKSHGEAILEGTMEYESLLDNASFVLPLRAGDDGNAGGIPVMWGTGNYHNLKNDNDEFNWTAGLAAPTSAWIRCSARAGWPGLRCRGIRAGLTIATRSSAAANTTTQCPSSPLTSAGSRMNGSACGRWPGMGRGKSTSRSKRISLLSAPPILRSGRFRGG